MFTEINKKAILDIFRIAAQSSKEDAIAKYIKTELSAMGREFNVDAYGNIYNVSHPNRPILSAHMDTVQDEVDAALAKFINIYPYDGGTEVLKGLGVIGGDDKCGIYVILEILRKTADVNFVFSKEEEVGCVGIRKFTANVDLKDKKITYGIVIDRRYASDIICVNNSYGTTKFQDALEKIGKEFGYKGTSGSSSDAGELRNFFSCANLSAAYFRPHSKQEYVKLNELIKVKNYVWRIITELTDHFEAPKISTYSGGSSYTGGAYINGRKWDYKLNRYVYEDEDPDYWRRKNTGNASGGTGKKKKGTTTTPASSTSNATNKLFPFYGTCDVCKKYTSVYRISILLTNVCAECKKEVTDELELIDAMNDPFYASEDGTY